VARWTNRTVRNRRPVFAPADLAVGASA